MISTFADTLRGAVVQAGTYLAVGLVPQLDRIPFAFTRYDDPFLPYSKAVIDATADLVCGYAFHLGAYLAHGAAGAVALERSIAYVPDGHVKVLHAPFASADFVRAAFDDAFDCHAVTIAQGTPAVHIIPYLQQPAFGVFLEGDETLLGKRLTETYPEQVGGYAPIHDQSAITCHLIGIPEARLYWAWADPIFRVRGDEYAAGWRQEIQRLRDALSRSQGKIGGLG